ncbi:hypothetical protein FGB62_53g00 [Gracilaria domingensis]|nr:hypothetical protein FGB62_53g00 [Gracilaria domingensis]
MTSAPESPPPAPSKPSSTWTSYLGTVKDKFNPFEGRKGSTRPNITYSEAALSVATTPYFIIQGRRSTLGSFKGDPDTNINRSEYLIEADKYMAQCITKQYKMTAAPYGTYNVQCTEGTVRGQAESGRKLALSTDFRMKQRSVFQKFADYTETRRKAIIAAHGCTYEENLLVKFPIAARSYLRAGAEAKSVCSRYATDKSPAENYMASSVVRQNMMRKVPNGVYDLMCSDGNESGGAEYKRVQALSAQFRAAQQPTLVKEKVKFDSCKFARDSYGHLCSYEENLFNSYPAVSASMRPNSSY